MTEALISIRTLTEVVGVVFDIPPRDLRGSRGPASRSLARHALCLLAREMTSFSSATISRHIGDRDHTITLYGAKKARELCESDPDFASKVAVARQAANTIARSELARLMRDPDAAAIAQRICRDPMREAARVSTLETAAIAARLLDLEDAAAAAFQLLSRIDQFAALRPSTAAGHIHKGELNGAIKTIATTLSDALGALGYRTEEEEIDNDSHHDAPAA